MAKGVQDLKGKLDGVLQRDPPAATTTGGRKSAGVIKPVATSNRTHAAIMLFIGGNWLLDM